MQDQFSLNSGFRDKNGPHTAWIGSTESWIGGYVHQHRKPFYWRMFQRRGLLLNDTPPKTILHQELSDGIVWGSLEPKQVLLVTCA